MNKIIVEDDNSKIIFKANKLNLSEEINGLNI